MTIRLLCAYSIYPQNAIVTLDAGTEAGLVAANIASTNLTGGVPYVPPPVPNQLIGAQLIVAPDKTVLGVLGPSGETISIGGGSSAPTYTVLSQTSVTTSNTSPFDGNAVACPAGVCNGLMVNNTSPHVIEYQRNGAGSFYPVRPFEKKFIWGITDASQVSVRLRDYALATTQTSSNYRLATVSLQLLNASASPAVGQVNGSSGNGGTYNAMPSAACTAIEILNTGIDFFIRKTGGSSCLVRKGTTYRFNGITNLNQLQSTCYGTPNSYSVEYFQADPQLPLREWLIAEEIASDAAQYHRDTLFGDDVFTTLGDAAPKMPFNTTGTMLALFTDVATANITASSGTFSAADTALTGDGINMTGLTSTALHITATSAATIRCAPPRTAAIPVDMTNCDIHARINRIGATGGVTNAYIELHSAGSPSALTGNYHQITLLTSRNASSFGAESRPISDAIAIGSGADLTQVLFCVYKVVCASGTVVNPQFIRAVKKASTSAKVIFTIDDFKPGAVTGALPLLGAVGYVGICYPSADVSLNPLGTTGATGHDALLALQTMGWQIAAQEYNREPSTDFAPAGWLKENKKNMSFGIALGFDPEGLRDGSAYGGGSYLQTMYSKYLPRLLASSRSFVSGNDLQGGSFNGYIVGTTLTLTSSSAQPIVPGAILVADNATGISDDQKIGVLLTGTANTSGATYSVTVSQTVGSSGSPVAFATESLAPFYGCETNPPGDPWSIRGLYWDASFASTNPLNLYAKYRLHLDQAIAAKGIAVFATHDGWSGALTSLQNTAMAHFLKYCKRKEASGLVENTTFVRMRRKQALV